MRETTLSRDTPVTFERGRGVQAVKVQRNIAHFIVAVGSDAHRSQRILSVFKAMAAQHIPIFLIKLHRTVITFAVRGEFAAVANEAIQPLAFEVTTRNDLVLVTVEATQMRDLFGVMAQIAEAIYSADARLIETGDSHNTVQCLIDSSHLVEAVEALRNVFHLATSQIEGIAQR
ncbi:MAG: hypothetical protein M1330_04170 [Armatimonadetes bacterium]|nr:hypothetical protein [Armatimonadota bacterium]